MAWPRATSAALHGRWLCMAAKNPLFAPQKYSEVRIVHYLNFAQDHGWRRSIATNPARHAWILDREGEETLYACTPEQVHT